MPGEKPTEEFKVVLIANDDDHPLPDWVAAELAAHNIAFVHRECHSREDLEACARDADVLWLMSSRTGLVTEQNMDIFEKAGAAIKCGSGTDNIDHEACTKRGIIVAHTPDLPTEPTSDHAIALLFAAVRQIPRQDRLIRRGIWNVAEAEPLGLFSQAALGIIGCGRIGSAIARKLAGFQMRILVFDPYLEEDRLPHPGVAKTTLPRLLTECQYVVVSCPLTRETRGLLGEKELRMMRPDAVLVNAARAGIVDEAALAKALREKWIAAAAFDVLEKHPRDPNDELLSFDNLTLTPHMGGNAPDHSNRIFRATVDIIIGLSQKRMPKWIVNKGVTPRWRMIEEREQ